MHLATLLMYLPVEKKTSMNKNRNETFEKKWRKRNCAKAPKMRLQLDFLFYFDALPEKKRKNSKRKILVSKIEIYHYGTLVI